MKPYVMLKPVKLEIDDSNFHLIECYTDADIRTAIADHIKDGVVAIDFETRGVRAYHPSNYTVCVSLCDGHSTICLHWPDASDEESCKFLTKGLGEALQERSGIRLIAHNLAFECMWFEDWLPNWHGCTYTMFKFLASEGWFNQKWGLKEAQVDLLGWEAKGDVAVDEWLIANGYKRGKGADKSQMWRTPVEILGYYNCLDSYSTWHLWNSVFRPVLEMPIMANLGPILEAFLSLNRAVRESVFKGIPVNKKKHAQYLKVLDKQRETAKDKFLNHPKVKEFRAILNDECVAAIAEKEPPKMTKSGKISQRYVDWLEKLEKARVTDHFNVASSHQLNRLFYDFLGNEIIIRTKPTEANPKGNPSTGKAALPLLGDVGRLLQKVKKYEKEADFAKRLTEQLEFDGRVRAEMKVPGTITMRLSGAGGFSLHQVPKSAGFLGSWEADRGYTLISQDVDALEQVVLTELSGDETLLSLYGPDAKPNDVYLRNGSAIPKIGDSFRAAGYDPINPTIEGISNAKKTCKKERNIAKLLTLSCIAEGELVRTFRRGLVPIESVEDDDLIWDGVEYVKHAGLVRKGYKEVINEIGIRTTKDHLIKTYKGWKVHEGLRKSECVRPESASHSWSDVWRMAGAIFRGLARRWL